MPFELREIVGWVRTSGVRLLLKTLPSKQRVVARKLRRRIKNRLDSEKIAVPYPHGVVITRPE
jgi:small-conductance mechanosensitive channel